MLTSVHDRISIGAVCLPQLYSMCAGLVGLALLLTACGPPVTQIQTETGDTGLEAKSIRIGDFHLSLHWNEQMPDDSIRFSILPQSSSLESWTGRPKDFRPRSDSSLVFYVNTNKKSPSFIASDTASVDTWKPSVRLTMGSNGTMQPVPTSGYGTTQSPIFLYCVSTSLLNDFTVTPGAQIVLHLVVSDDDEESQVTLREKWMGSSEHTQRSLHFIETFLKRQEAMADSVK